MDRRAAIWAFSFFVFVLLLVVAISYEKSPPDKEKVNALYRKYVDTAFVMKDTVIDFSIKGDYLVLHFPGKPQCRKWMVWYRANPDTAICTLNEKKEIILTGDDVKNLSDTTFFSVTMMPYDSQKVYMWYDWMDTQKYSFVNNNKGQLIAYHQHPANRINLALYDEIEDAEFRKAVIAKINEKLWEARHSYQFQLPEEMK